MSAPAARAGGSRWQRLRSALTARFDDAALRPFESGARPGLGEPGPAAAASESWPALRRWCVASTGPLAVAHCSAVDRAAAWQAAAQVGLDLDGSYQLRACRGGLARVALRLRVKLQDAAGGMADLDRGVWDSGWVPDEPAARQALAAWTPRRPSFIVLASASAHILQAALQTLVARSQEYAHPVRVLVLLPPGAAVGLDALCASSELPPPGAAYMPA